MQIATCIAGYANMDTRDRHGNLSPDVWVRHSDKNCIGNLVDAADMKQLLLQQIQNHLSKNKEILQEIADDSVAVQWILKFSHMWEKKYRGALNKNFDIAQRIQTAMYDTFYEVEDVLEECPEPALRPSTVRRLVQNTLENDSTTPMHHNLTLQDAVIRLYFRNPHTQGVMCRLAGKILQKKEVCNRAGSYSAKVQRNDITQEQSNAFNKFLHTVANDTETHALFANFVHSNYLVYWLRDHTYTDPHEEQEQQLDF